MIKGKNNKSGITLIALVISIIVLLILAGISIAMLSGDNGILSRATDAKTNTDNAQIKERIQLAYHSALTGGQGSYTKDTLMEELKNEFKTNYDVDDSDEDNWILKAHGQEIIIPAGKEDTSKVIIKVGTTNLKEVSDLTTLYGEITDYTSIIDVQWQLFYDDSDYIYLIASDFVPYSILPNDLIKSTSTYNNYSEYCANFLNNEIILEGAPYKDGTASSVLLNNPLTSKYLKWIGCGLDTVSNNPNMSAVAFMMDTSKWSSFAGDAVGAFAMGGPTLEMFVLSYNAKHSVKLGTYDPMPDNTNADSNGYKVKIGDNSWTNNIAYGLDTSEGNMWIKAENVKAERNVVSFAFFR